jgi:hypothetical protein
MTEYEALRRARAERRARRHNNDKRLQKRRMVRRIREKGGRAFHATVYMPRVPEVSWHTAMLRLSHASEPDPAVFEVESEFPYPWGGVNAKLALIGVAWCPIRGPVDGFVRSLYETDKLARAQGLTPASPWHVERLEKQFSRLPEHTRSKQFFLVVPQQIVRIRRHKRTGKTRKGLIECFALCFDGNEWHPRLLPFGFSWPPDTFLVYCAR